MNSHKETHSTCECNEGYFDATLLEGTTSADVMMPLHCTKECDGLSFVNSLNLCECPLGFAL